MSHFNQLFSDVRSVCDTVIVSYGGSSSYQDIPKAGLADIASSMIACEPLNKHRGIFVFAVHEYHFIWYEYILKEYHCFLSRVHGIAGIDVTAFHASGIA